MQRANRPAIAIPGRPAGRGSALKQLFSRISETAKLATGARQLVQLTQRPGDLETVQELIQSDPAVAAQILRRVNSPYYHLDAEVHDLTSAAHLLGVQELSNVAFTIYLSRMFSTPMTFGTFSVSGLWAHSVAVAATAQLIARVCGQAVPKEAFLAGLLHDLGLLLCSKQMRRRFMDVVERAAEQNTPTHEVEHSIYSFDHAQLGGYVLRDWGFSETIRDAVAHHHDVEGYTGSQKTLLYVVSAANYLCSHFGWTSLGVHNLEAPSDDTYRILGLDQVALSIICKEIVERLHQSSSFAEL